MRTVKPTVQRVLRALSLVASLPLAAYAGDGLQLSPGSNAWPQWPTWQARMAVSEAAWGISTQLADGRRPLLGASTLAGDRYFDLGHLGDGGGLRATGALAFGGGLPTLAAPLDAAPIQLARQTASLARPSELSEASVASTYLGLGYSAWWARSGLGLSADLGLWGQRASALRSERIFNNNETLAEQARAMQWAPLLKVQLSYAF